MCYAIPGIVSKVVGNVAFVDYFGERRKAIIDGLSVTSGDYVYVQGGYIIQRVSAHKATAMLNAWKEVFKALERKDRELSPDVSLQIDDKLLASILRRAKAGLPLRKSDALYLINLDESEKVNLLYRVANYLRRINLRNSCCVHGIIEFSNVCRNDCAYCGLRRSNKKLRRYRMSEKEIIACADYAVNRLGFKALMLQSGEDTFFTTEKLVWIIERIRERCHAIIFVSVGERSEEDYQRMYDAGARGALIRFETSNQELYAKLHEGQPLKERLACIRCVRKMGYAIATGSLIGLPGQKSEDLINDIFLTKALGAEMYSFGPFIPHPDTPLGNCRAPTQDNVLKVIAISRLVDNKAKILVTTALETLSGGKRLGFLAGANSCMIDVTPAKYKVNYQLYPRKMSTDVKEIRNTVTLLRSLGRAPTDFGIA